MTKRANLHDAIEMAHSGRPNRRKRRAPLVETIDMRAIFRSKCRQAGHENRHWELDGAAHAAANSDASYRVKKSAHGNATSSKTDRLCRRSVHAFRLLG